MRFTITELLQCSTELYTYWKNIYWYKRCI